ncbi:hypothetical protein FRB99_005998 [Tulasnella sp. 403]|nr:hypothetical protein FRB99_005998 [Tulasnella sp. 403]
MSIVAPNITFQESFFLKMKSDLGDYYSSPDFELAPSNLLVNKSSVMSTAATGSFSATLVTPSAQANPMSAQTAQKGPSPLAIGIPVAMLILTTIGALAFCMTRSHRQHREAGGGAAASLGPRTMGGQNSGETKGIGSGHADAAFFNLTLNKTSSELSAVEKAVCGAINTSIPARPEGQRREAKPPRRTSNASFRKERSRSTIPDDDCYTVPPPRTWQRSEIGRQRTRDRAWVSERQRQRALEREYDKQWEAECRERARRRMYPRLPPHQYGYDEYDRPYPTRHSPDSWRPSEYDLDERMYGRSLTSRPYHRGPLLPDRFLSGTPPEIQQPFPNPHRSWSDPIRAPHTELYSRYDVPAEPTSSHMESDQDYDHHASLSVVSAYCMPSPMVPQEPSVSSLPPSLQAGRPGNSSTGPRLPPGLEHMAKLRTAKLANSTSPGWVLPPPDRRNNAKYTGLTEIHIWT